MDFFKAVSKRKAIRCFLPKNISATRLNLILENSLMAPSAGNLQSYRIVVVKNPKLKEKIAHICNKQDFIAVAPILLVFLADQDESASKYGGRGAQLFCIQDATLAAGYAQLAAAALGLGSLWVGAFNPDEIRKLVNGDAHELPVVVVPLGYPAKDCKFHRGQQYSIIGRGEYYGHVRKELHELKSEI